MPRRREVGRHPSLPPVPQAEPTTKPASVTSAIRRLVVANQTMPAKAISAMLDETGWPNVKMSTITTIRADALATLREAAALGLFVTAAEQKPEPTPARPRRSRSRRPAPPVTEAETASA